MQKQTIQKVAIIGGTHGNELTGVYLAKKWIADNTEVQRENFAIEIFYANPEATDIMKRYVNQDLNRSFALADIQNPTLTNHEQTRAKELNTKIGPKDAKNPAYDFMIDMHSSTSNLGTNIIITDNDPYSLLVAGLMQEKDPSITITIGFEDRMEQPYITSLTPHAITLELGPIPQGVLRADTLKKMKDAMQNALDVIEALNNTDDFPDMSLSVYEMKRTLDYPKDANGNIIATIHPDREGGEFAEIKVGDPLFMDFDENTIYYEGDPAYTYFINEAAYYEKGIACMLVEKKVINI